MAHRTSRAGFAEAFMHPSLGRNPQPDDIGRHLERTALEAVLAVLAWLRTRPR